MTLTITDCKIIANKRQRKYLKGAAKSQERFEIF